MSAADSAALWSLVGGTVGGLISGMIILLVGRSLRRRGEIRSNFENWRFRYVLKMADEFEDLQPDRIDPAEEQLGDDAVVNRAWYGFTAHLFNEKEVRVALRNARVVFLSSGGEKFAEPLKGKGFELTGGTMQLEARESIVLVVRSTIRGKQLASLTSGWDEVRLRATRENGSVFDRRVALITTTSPRGREASYEDAEENV